MGDLDISKKKDVYNELMQQLKVILHTLSPYVSKNQAYLLSAMRVLFRYPPFEDQTLLTNLEQAFLALEKLPPKDFVKAMVSKARSIKMDIGDIKLGSDEQQYALAHFLHSEQLAYTWMLRKGNHPKNYMYTQRRMCETCNPLIIRMFRTCPTKFYYQLIQPTVQEELPA